MNCTNQKELPSEKIQKEYEINPSYILKKIRKENSNSLENNIIEETKNLDKKIISSQKNIFLNSDFEDLEKLNNNFIENNNYYMKDNIKDSNINNISNNNIINNNGNKIKEKDQFIDNCKNENNAQNNLIKCNNITNTNFSFLFSSSNNTQKHIFNGASNIMIKYDIKTILKSLKNYWGSIHFQYILNNMNDNDISCLLLNIMPYINDIMCYQYGNYFFQKFIKRLNSHQRIKIYQIIEPLFPKIATNKSGTHSIQSLIDEIKTPMEQLALDNLLNKNMIILFNDKYAYHIIMKIILKNSENKRNNINLFIINNIKDIIINPYGAYCVNKFIVNNIDINLIILLLKNIHNNIHFLFFHKSSCSILFLLLKYYNYKSCNFIFEEIKNKLFI